MNPWIQHVKAFASKKGINYSDALKHPDVKKGYKPKKGGVILFPDGYIPDPPQQSAPKQTAPPRTPFTFGDTRVEPPKKEPPAGFTFGKTTTPPPPGTFGTNFPSRQTVRGKVPVRGPPPPPSPPPIPTIQINSIPEFERFLEDKKDVIRQVLMKDYTKKTFVVKFHPDKCITTSKAVEDLMMKVLGRKVVVNAPHIRVCEAIFKKFSGMF